jgi:hypothetical protein
LVEAPEQEAAKWAKDMRYIMETPVPELGNAVFPIDLKWGTNWGQLEKWKS